MVTKLKTYYNFFTDKNFNLCSVIFPDLRESIEIPFRVLEKVPNQSKKKRVSIFENKIETKKLNIEFLESKHLMINRLIHLKDEYFKKNNNNNKYLIQFLCYLK